MRRRTTLSLILALTGLLSLMSFQGSAQRGGQSQRRASQDTPGTGGQRPSAKQDAEGSQPKVTVVRKLSRINLSAAAIKTIRSMDIFRLIVAVQGTTIRPLAGSSLWQLSNGSHLVLGGSTVKPEVYASEIYTHDTPAGVVVWACYCPGYDPNKDDGCKFDGAAGPITCKQMGGVNCTCKFEDFLIFTDGSVLGYEGPRGD